MSTQQYSFLLCVGAQKSGTTWLYEYLRASKCYDLGMLKEYHVWDALSIPECRPFLSVNPGSLIYRLQTEPGAYETYFRGLVTSETPNTADITPAYAGLSTHVFSHIKNRLESVGFKVYVVFIMRDPFERCWSAYRMSLRNSNSTGIALAINNFRNIYRSSNFFFRTNYVATIQNLEAAFHQDQILYLIYEEMFDRYSLKKLSKFLDIPINPDFIESKFNVSPQLENVPNSLKIEIFNFYDFVYKFCFKRFPTTRKLWRRLPSDLA